MGNSSSAPADTIYNYAKVGDYHKLRALLTQLRADSTYEANHRQQLDTACTQDGDTPLIAAARGGHYQVVELLLNSGASLHPQTQRQGGGTALHEAIARRQDHVIDLLLAAGTNSFVENAQGFTPLDVACSLRNVDLLRRLESGAPWSGWLLMKVTRLGGLGTEWQRRWVVVSHRFPNPATPPDRRLVHVVINCFKTSLATSPSCRAWLDGARVVEVYSARAASRTHGCTPSQVELRLHNKHVAPSGAFTTGAQRGGFALHFRPDDATSAGCDSLRMFMFTVNNRGYRPERAAAPAPARPAAAAAVPRPSSQQQYQYAPMGHAASGGIAATQSDAELARQMQEEEDRQFALQVQNGASPERVRPAAAPTPSPATGPRLQPPLGVNPPISQPSQDISQFYPTINFDASFPATPSVPSQAGQQAAHAYAHSSISVSAYPSAPAMSPMPGMFGGASPATAAAASPPAGGGAEDDNTCIVCMDQPIEVGFLHGSTVHKQCCRGCAGRIMAGNQQCPACRDRIERVVNIF